MRKIVIIGNGISGITCARNVRKMSDDPITIISSETEHFFSRTALMYVYMGHMKYDHIKPYEDFFWKKNRLELVFDLVINVDIHNKQLMMRETSPINFDILVLATGSVTKKYGWPGQDLKGVAGLYSFQDLQQIESQTKHVKKAIIAGGGLIGVELAEMLHTRKIDTTILVRDKYYWGSVLPQQDARLVGDHIARHGIKILYETELKEIIGDKEGKVNSIITTSGQEIICEFVGISTGVSPNVEFLKNSGIKTDKGILVNAYFETNMEGIYAIGDCAQFTEPNAGRKPIEQIWYTGRMHGETLAHNLCGKRKMYDPGPFFNSAKFFDLEYQTYGNVPGKIPEDDDLFIWKHPNKEISLTFLFNKKTKEFKGINCYGTRLRHENFDKWLRDKVSIDHVISNLSVALFDKEFEKNYVGKLIISYNTATKSNLKKSKKTFFNYV